MKTTPALLQGIDYEGETRSDWYPSINSAIKAGSNMCFFGDYAWKSFEVWANDENTGEWCLVHAAETYDNRKAKCTADNPYITQTTEVQFRLNKRHPGILNQPNVTTGGDK